MKPRTRRALFIGGGLLALASTSMLVLNAFQSNLVFYFGPSDVMANEAPVGSRFRMGGIVREGSVQRAASTVDVYFHVTDGTESIPVAYSGFLPDMFREGKGVVVHGRLNSAGVFQADEVLAKHDENYMPPDAAESLAEAERKRIQAQTQAQAQAQAASMVALTPETAQ